MRSPAVVLTAALAHGVGWRTDRERTDLLMQDAADDLFSEALQQLGRAEDDPEIAAIAAHLRAPLHPDRYLSPMQMAERFRTALARKAAHKAAVLRWRKAGALVSLLIGALSSVVSMAEVADIDLAELAQRLRGLSRR